MSNDYFSRLCDVGYPDWKPDRTIFTSKLFFGIEPDRGRGKIYAKLRRRLVSTRRHINDKALPLSVPCILGILPAANADVPHENMYEREISFTNLRKLFLRCMLINLVNDC